MFPSRTVIHPFSGSGSIINRTVENNPKIKIGDILRNIEMYLTVTAFQSLKTVREPVLRVRAVIFIVADKSRLFNHYRPRASGGVVEKSDRMHPFISP